MECQGLKHALECLIPNFDEAVKTFAWTSKRPCAQRSFTKIACKKVSFATIGWTNRQGTTHHPIKLIGLSLGKAVKIKGINKMIIPFE
jgi:hypothetical protein